MSAHPSPPARDRLLDAAERLVAENGTSRLTLDAVAQAAGVSKGGLLYHFPSKSALLGAMVERHIDHVEQRIARVAAEDPAAAANPLRAHVLALLEAMDEKRAVGAALLAAAADDPELLGTCRRHYAAAVERLGALPCGFDGAVVVMLAVDGLLLGDLLRLTPFDADQRRRAVAALLRAADDCLSPNAAADAAPSP